MKNTNIFLNYRFKKYMCIRRNSFTIKSEIHITLNIVDHKIKKKKSCVFYLKCK